MKTKTYNRYNFHKHTFCIFKEIDAKLIENLQPTYLSKSGSAYYFFEEGLYRVANHWGRAANCRWKLDSSSIVNSDSKKNLFQVGYAKWTDFYPNNEQENLFYIIVDFETKIIDFQHKNNPNYDIKYKVRNASETAKRIKICKEVITETTWSKYLIFDAIDDLRKEIINELLTTNNSFIAIKRKYIGL